MKKFIYIALLALSFCPCYALQRVIERVYISTDRASYVAGERIWLSLYCFDLSGNEPRFSGVSSVAYVELRNGASLVSSAKLRIAGGRGSGNIIIPRSLPTGNYRLIAYTKQMFNEEEPAVFDKVISIYNTLSTERLPEGVLFEGDEKGVQGTTEKPNTQQVEVKLGVTQHTVPLNHSLPLSLQNVSGEDITLSLSIARIDLPAESNYSLHDFFALNQPDPAKIRFQDHYIPDYEGEVIRGRIINIRSIPFRDRTVYLSAAGKEVNVYAGPVDTRTGEFTFFTNSLYGDREIVLEYPALGDVSFELVDPFITPPIKPVPPLFLDKKTALPLAERSVEMQVSYRLGMDTLFDRTTILDDPLIYTDKPVVYLLDNYTRFPTMQDIMVEFITELRFRRVSGKPSLQVFLTDWGWALTDNPLVVIDGIAIFDHERLLQYDPLQVKSVSIYRNRYRIGNTTFDGIAKWDTYSGAYPGLTLGKNALIIDYQGVQFPCRFTGGFAASDDFPDVRTLLYWDPQIDLAQGAHQDINIRTSSMPGKYAIVLEGVTATGAPILFRSEFTVE